MRCLIVLAGQDRESLAGFIARRGKALSDTREGLSEMALSPGSVDVTVKQNCCFIRFPYVLWKADFIVVDPLLVDTSCRF